MYDALDVAEYVIYYEHDCGRSISNLRLQKLLYFVQAQFWVTRHHACFDDRMEAWNLGPVIPSVYHKYKLFGSLNLPRSLATDSGNINTRDRELINIVLDAFANYSTSQLVSWSHMQKPWKDAYERVPDKTISPDSMKDYFGDV